MLVSKDTLSGKQAAENVFEKSHQAFIIKPLLFHYNWPEI